MSQARTSELIAADRSAVVHPFTAARAYEDGDAQAFLVEGGSGSRIKLADGSTLLDAFAGLYCVNVGYGRTEIADAISKQAHKLAYYHSYAGHTNEPLARLSERLIALTGGRMSKVFYGQSGSDANETNAKLVWHYHNLIGRPQKKKIIARDRGYHGCSILSGSMTGMSFYHNHMDLPLPIVRHVGSPHHWRDARPDESECAFSARRAAELEDTILKEGPETVGAFIAEPLLGTGGIVPPPEGYWEAISTVLKRYDVLLIADEVVCGFGRIGAPFGSDYYGIEPDLMTLAKGLTSAYVPLSASMIGPKIWDVLRNASDEVGPFSHGYTYSGHPIGAAAANACLDIYESEDLPARAKATGARLLNGLRGALAQHPMVGEVRGVGMLAAVELVADRGAEGAARFFDPTLKVGARASNAARERGLITRAMPHGDILGFAPPLVMTEDEVDEVVTITAAAVKSVADDLARDGQFAGAF